MRRSPRAHTGDISAEMIADCFGTHVILGHSERRTDHKETDAEVRAKTEAALAAGLVAIVCIGETEAERKGGKTLEVLKTAACRSLSTMEQRRKTPSSPMSRSGPLAPG